MAVPGFLLPVYEVRRKPLEGDGRTIPLAQLTFYKARTGEKHPVYVDTGLTEEHDNPLTADEDGEFPTFYYDEHVGYHERCTRADGSLVYGADLLLTGPRVEE
jgi:hypothetical protein